MATGIERVSESLGSRCTGRANAAERRLPSVDQMEDSLFPLKWREIWISFLGEDTS
jgi:hypothetical protein